MNSPAMINDSEPDPEQKSKNIQKGKKDREFPVVSSLLNLLFDKVILQNRIILHSPFNT